MVIAVDYVVLTQTPGEVAGLLAGLTPEEKARAARLKRMEDQALYVAAHALLHAAVFQATGQRPRGFRRGEQGKPELDPGFGDPPLAFSLAHARGLVACALAPGMALGVDVERIEPGVDGAGIAAMQFAASERAALAAAPAARRAELFHRIWTLREAVAKALGEGLGRGAAFAVALDPLALDRAAEDAARGLAWHLEECAAVPGWRMALAARHPASPPPAVCWREIGLAELAARLP